NLIALARPTWRRLLEGQPHLGFEYCWSAQGLCIGLWVPQCVPPGMVEHAAEAAWPGCRAASSAPTPPIPMAAQVTGGRLRLAEPEWFPLNTAHEVDPLRPLLGAAGQLDATEQAVVQV